MKPLLHGSKPTGPRLDALRPPAAMPGGEVELLGSGLQERTDHCLPVVRVGDTRTHVTLSRSDRATIRVLDSTISGEVELEVGSEASNKLGLRVAVPMAEGLHPVTNPAVDSDGTVYSTVSGTRGQSVPVSIFSIARDFQMRPFVRDLMNATGLAFGPDGFLYASSRAEGTVYRISSTGEMSVYAEGMGIATGIAFDGDGNLYVGDRSGTIFRVGPDRGPLAEKQIFVYATLEPSVAAYHLAFNNEATLFVTGPTTSSHQPVYAIDRNGHTTVFYRGLGRAQGIALDVDSNLYVAASLHGQRGIIRITPQREASVALSGNNLVGLAFLEDGMAVLATRDALYHVALDIEGRPLP